jgi:hypothetical protein
MGQGEGYHSCVRSSPSGGEGTTCAICALAGRKKQIIEQTSRGKSDASRSSIHSSGSAQTDPVLIYIQLKYQECAIETDRC